MAVHHHISRQRARAGWCRPGCWLAHAAERGACTCEISSTRLPTPIKFRRSSSSLPCARQTTTRTAGVSTRTWHPGDVTAARDACRPTTVRHTICPLRHTICPHRVPPGAGALQSSTPTHARGQKPGSGAATAEMDTETHGWRHGRQRRRHQRVSRALDRADRQTQNEECRPLGDRLDATDLLHCPPEERDPILQHQRWYPLPWGQVQGPVCSGAFASWAFSSPLEPTGATLYCQAPTQC